MCTASILDGKGVFALGHPGSQVEKSKVYMRLIYHPFCWSRSLARFERPADNRKVLSSNLSGTTHLLILSSDGEPFVSTVEMLLGSVAAGIAMMIRLCV